MKKILALVLALAMVFAVAVASAATIEVKNVINGEHYTAYKILNYTANGNAVSYYLTSEEYASIGSVLETAGFAFTASADGTQYFLNNAATVDVAAAAESLGTANLGNALGKYEVDAANGKAEFTNLPTGYYFVSSSAGSLCALHSETDIATAVEKNTIPGEDKKQSTAANGTYTDDTLDFNIGDTVYYQVEITDGKGTDSTITLTDNMTDGLTYNNDAKVYFNDTEVTAGENTFTLTNGTPSSGFTIVFAPAYVAGLAENAVVTVKYSAVINENAAIDSDANTNTATLTYSQQTQTDFVKLETYDILVKKVDGQNQFLDGAEFTLYDALTGGNQIKLSSDSNGLYVDPNGDATLTIDVNSAEGTRVRGLKPGDYYLEETVVPNGYNKLAAREKVTVTSGATAAVEVVVTNNAGTQLPSTGGIGTTIFYILGGVLIVAAAVILVARKKASN